MLAQVRLIAITNRETWVERVEVRDEAGAVFDLSAEEARLELSARPCGSAVLTAVSGDGVLSTHAEGVIEWEVPVERMRTLQPGLYDIGLTCTIESSTVQILVGTIEIVDGLPPAISSSQQWAKSRVYLDRPSRANSPQPICCIVRSPGPTRAPSLDGRGSHPNRTPPSMP